MRASSLQAQKHTADDCHDERIIRAQQLIRQTLRSLIEIGLEVGYSNPGDFPFYGSCPGFRFALTSSRTRSESHLVGAKIPEKSLFDQRASADKRKFVLNVSG